MRKVCLLLFLLLSQLLAVDFDCIVIGTSPIPLCEAIYQANIGKSVLVLDQWPESGGAWKSITACGVPHADMGCHQLVGANWPVKSFLEMYLGCKMVPMETPLEPCNGNNNCLDFYFSKGCHELIGNLERIIAQTNIVYLLNHAVKTVTIEPDQLVVKTEERAFSTNKVITIPCSYFKIDGIPINQPEPLSPIKYWHLYLLIQDPTSPKFSYLNYSYSGVSRCMNLTHFVDLTNSGTQLFVFQAFSPTILDQKEAILEDMKQKNLIDPSAYILKSDLYDYEQFRFNTSWHHKIPKELKDSFEILDTSAFGSMSRYIYRWEKAMKPFNELFPYGK